MHCSSPDSFCRANSKRRQNPVYGENRRAWRRDVDMHGTLARSCAVGEGPAVTAWEFRTQHGAMRNRRGMSSPWLNFCVGYIWHLSSPSSSSSALPHLVIQWAAAHWILRFTETDPALLRPSGVHVLCIILICTVNFICKMMTVVCIKINIPIGVHLYVPRAKRMDKLKG